MSSEHNTAVNKDDTYDRIKTMPMISIERKLLIVINWWGRWRQYCCRDVTIFPDFKKFAGPTWRDENWSTNCKNCKIFTTVQSSAVQPRYDSWTVTHICSYWQSWPFWQSMSKGQIIKEKRFHRHNTSLRVIDIVLFIFLPPNSSIVANSDEDASISAQAGLTDCCSALKFW